MSNRLFRPDYSGYYFAKGDLACLESREWTLHHVFGEILALTEEEKELEEFMEEKRQLMAGCSVCCPHHKCVYPPAEAFGVQKEFIRQNDLFTKIFRKMPKGGLLHIHGMAALSAEGLIKLLLEWNRENGDRSSRIRILNAAIPSVSEKYAKGTLFYEYQCREIMGNTLLLEDYLKAPGNWKRLYKMLSFGGRKLQRKNTESAKMWEKYNVILSRTAGLFENREFYKGYYEAFFEECMNDGIRYVELRCGFEKFRDAKTGESRGQSGEYCAKKALYFKDRLTEVNPVCPDHAFVDAILDAGERIRLKYGTDAFGVKLILTAQRSLNPFIKEERECLCKRIDGAVALKEHYLKQGKEVIIGFDLEGPEDGCCKIDDYAKKIIYKPIGDGYENMEESSAQSQDKREKTGQAGWIGESRRQEQDMKENDGHAAITKEKLRIERIDFFLHAGESNWFFNDNLKTAVIISKHRIGHGFNLNRVPGIMHGIARGPKVIIAEPVLEICPIYDRTFGYCRNFQSHPLYEYIKSGILCVIGNDSPQLLGNPGISYDLWEAYMGMGLTLPMLKLMIFTTYLYEFMDYHAGSIEIEKAKQKFLQDWDSFLEEVQGCI